MNMAVETFGLAKAYKSVFAVDHIDLKVPAGSVCGFLGKNGAGKTTTLKMLTGQKRPTAGEFAIMGKKKGFGAGVNIGESVGYLPDVPDFYGYMNGQEFLLLCGKLCGMAGGALREHVRSLLKQVNLNSVKTPIAGYSRGMRQRLGIAQALINSPPVIFMDEPISALDPMGRRDVMEIISGINAGKSTTVVLSTHILSDVESICDYVIIIHKGKVLIQDGMGDLKRRFAKNAAELEFYEEAHRIKFEQALKNTGKAEAVERDDPGVQLTTRVSPLNKNGESGEISGICAAVLAENAMPFKSFNMHAPSLDDIFHDAVDAADKHKTGGARA